MAPTLPEPLGRTAPAPELLTPERLAEALPAHRYCSPSYPREHEACLASARATLRNLGVPIAENCWCAHGGDAHDELCRRRQEGDR